MAGEVNESGAPLQPRLMAVLAHPDDESLGIGGTLPHYSAQGVSTHLVCATRGERGRYFDNSDRPSDDEVGRIREGELMEAARVLGVSDVRLLGYRDGSLDAVSPRGAIGRIVAHIRRVRPQVIITFDPWGGYGHPDHIAISQFAMAAVAAAASADFSADGEPHLVAKLYFITWGEEPWALFQRAFKQLGSTVDGVQRHASPWPGWSITTRIDATAHAESAWRAVQCHRTQMSMYGELENLSSREHQQLWGEQTFYRAMSVVNGGRAPESDLFAGLR